MRQQQANEEYKEEGWIPSVRRRTYGKLPGVHFTFIKPRELYIGGVRLLRTSIGEWALSFLCSLVINHFKGATHNVSAAFLQLQSLLCLKQGK